MCVCVCIYSIYIYIYIYILFLIFFGNHDKVLGDFFDEQKVQKNNVFNRINWNIQKKNVLLSLLNLMSLLNKVIISLKKKYYFIDFKL